MHVLQWKYDTVKLWTVSEWVNKLICAPYASQCNVTTFIAKQINGWCNWIKGAFSKESRQTVEIWKPCYFANFRYFLHFIYDNHTKNMNWLQGKQNEASFEGAEENEQRLKASTTKYTEIVGPTEIMRFKW